MGTCNFWGAGPFGYITCIEEYDEEWYGAEYPDEDGYTDDDRWAAFRESCEDTYEYAAGRAEKAVESLNDTLAFHRFEVAGGYYDGVEIRFEHGHWTGARAPHDPDDWEELACILDEREGCDCSDRPRHQRRARRMYEEECDRIAEWIDTTARDLGFSPMGCVARFDNGEAWYSRSEHVPAVGHDIGPDIGCGLQEGSRVPSDWECEHFLGPLWATLETSSQTPSVEM